MKDTMKAICSVTIDSIWYNVVFKCENDNYTVIFLSDVVGNKTIKTDHERWNKFMEQLTKNRKISGKGNPYTQMYESIYTIQDKLKVA